MSRFSGATILLLGLFGATAVAPPAVAAEPDIASEPVVEDVYPRARVSFADGVTGLPDLIFATLPGFRPLTLDLYLPADSKPKPAAGYPLVIYIHAGGWMAGHARHSGAFSNFPDVLAALAAKGYVVASVNYRLSSEAIYPAAVLDVKTAVRWLRSRAVEYGIDPARAIAWGSAAGGQIAGLVAVTCGAAGFNPNVPATEGAVDAAGRPMTKLLPQDVASQSDCLQGAVVWHGIFDFTSIRDQFGPDMPREALIPERAYLGCDLAKCASTLIGGASSTSYVDGKDPPMLLIHGTADKTVPHQQSEQMAAKLKESSIPVELLLLPDVAHGFIGPSHDATRAASLKALTATFAFIDKTIGAK